MEDTYVDYLGCSREGNQYIFRRAINTILEALVTTNRFLAIDIHNSIDDWVVDTIIQN